MGLLAPFIGGQACCDGLRHWGVMQKWKQFIAKSSAEYSSSKLGWSFLLFLNVLMFIYGIFTGDLIAIVTAFFLAFFIEKRGAPVLLEKYNDRVDRIRGQYNIQVDLTPEQRRAAIEEMRRSQKQKREERKAARKSK